MNELASTAGLSCRIDPILVQVLKVQRNGMCRADCMSVCSGSLSVSGLN